VLRSNWGRPVFASEAMTDSTLIINIEVKNVAEEITADVVKKFTNIKYDKSKVKKAIKLASNNILMEK
jgi:hypothetical protein